MFQTGDLATLTVRVTREGITLASSELEKLGRSADTVEKRTGRLRSAWDTADGATRRFSSSLQSLRGAFAALGIGAAAAGIVKATNTMASMRGQIALVTDSQDELNRVYERALKLSNETSVGLQTTVTLYTRLARSTADLGLSQTELFRVTDLLNKSFIVSGASAEEAQRSMVQLSQALAGGILRAEEFNSINEQTPYVLDQMAKGLGVTRGELRQMVVDGEVTSEQMIAAMQAMAQQIDADFEKMPDTVGRALTRIRNDFLNTFGNVDAGPLVEALEEFRTLTTDKNFVESMQTLAAAIVSVASAAAGATSTMVELVTYLAEEAARQFVGIADDDIGGLETRLRDLEVSTTGWRRTLSDLAGTTAIYEAEIRSLQGRIAAYYENQVDANAAATRGKEAAEGLTRSMEDLHEVTVDVVRVLDRFAPSAFDGAKGMISLEEGIRETNAAAYDSKKALREAGKELEGPFAKALEQTVARIDGAFADAWKGAFDSFSDFADGIKNALQQLLAEMAHLLLTRPLVMSIGAAFGIPGTAMAAGGGGGLTGAITSAGGLGNLLSGGASSLLSSFGGGVTNLLQNGAGLMESLGWNSGAQFFTGLENNIAQMGGGNMGLGSLYAAGSGILGGIASNAVFGPTSGIGNTLGGIASTAWLAPLMGPFAPLAPFIGSFLGGGVESLFGNNQPSDKTGTALLDLATGGVQIGGLTGKKFSQENRDAAAQLAELFKVFSGAIGGSSAVLDIGVGSRDGLRLDGRDYGDDMEAFIDAGFRKIMDAASELDPVLRSLIEGFQGGTEDTLRFTAAIVDLHAAIDVNPVQMARDAWAELTSQASTATQGYFEQAGALLELNAAYDGSAESTERLQLGLRATQEMAFQLAAAILDAQGRISGITGDSAQRIREAVMSADELRRSRVERRNSLAGELATMSDPTRIMETFRQIEQLNTQIFQALAPDQQKARADGFVAYIERINEVAQRRLENGLGDLESKVLEVNDALGETLLSGAAQMAQAAAQQQQAALDFAAAVREFGANASALLQYSEVNA